MEAKIYKLCSVHLLLACAIILVNLLLQNIDFFFSLASIPSKGKCLYNFSLRSEKTVYFNALKCSASLNNLVLGMLQLGIFKMIFEAHSSGESAKWDWTMQRGEKPSYLTHVPYYKNMRHQWLCLDRLTLWAIAARFGNTMSSLSSAVWQTWGRGTSVQVAQGSLDPRPNAGSALDTRVLALFPGF